MHDDVQIVESEYFVNRVFAPEDLKGKIFYRCTFLNCDFDCLEKMEAAKIKFPVFSRIMGGNESPEIPPIIPAIRVENNINNHFGYLNNSVGIDTGYYPNQSVAIGYHASLHANTIPDESRNRAFGQTNMIPDGSRNQAIGQQALGHTTPSVLTMSYAAFFEKDESLAGVTETPEFYECVIVGGRTGGFNYTYHKPQSHGNHFMTFMAPNMDKVNYKLNDTKVAMYKIHRTFALSLKEELSKVCFSPKRFARYLETYQYDIVDDEYVPAENAEE